MTKEQRKNQIISTMKSFDKAKYLKEEVLDEYYKLSKEIVDLTFNEEHADNSKLRLWHVEKHLENLNNEKNNRADNLLNEFKLANKAIINQIDKYKSGEIGELKAEKVLKTLICPNVKLKNVELSNEDFTSEIDHLVITEKGIFILEVKNTKKDILIDEKGNYIRQSDTHSFDCQIGEKMNNKVYLVRKALEENGIKNVNIISLLVFTNSFVKITNEYKYITHCFLSQLPHIIEQYDLEKIYSKEQMKEFVEAIEESRTYKEYYLKEDINEYKELYANLITELEYDDSLIEDSESIKEEVKKENDNPAALKEEKRLPIYKRLLGLALGSLVVFGVGYATRSLTKK